MQQSREASQTSWEAYQRAERDRARSNMRTGVEERYTLLNQQRASASVPPPPPKEIEQIFPIYLYEYDEEGEPSGDPKVIGYCKSLHDVGKFVQKLAGLSKFQGYTLKFLDHGMSNARYTLSRNESMTYTIYTASIKFDELHL